MRRPSPLFPLFIIFIFVSSFCLLFAPFLTKKGVDSNVLLISNLILFLLSIGTFFMQRKSLQSTNPHAFVRSVMGAMILKMVLCIVVLIIYVTSSEAGINKKAVFISLFLYLIYLAIEVSAVMKLNKKQNA